MLSPAPSDKPSTKNPSLKLYPQRYLCNVRPPHIFHRKPSKFKELSGGFEGLSQLPKEDNVHFALSERHRDRTRVKQLLKRWNLRDEAIGGKGRNMNFMASSVGSERESIKVISGVRKNGEVCDKVKYVKGQSFDASKVTERSNHEGQD